MKKNVFFTLFTLLVSFKSYSDNEDLNLTMIEDYKKISVQQIIEQPRYIVLIRNHRFCRNSYSLEEKSSIEYLISDENLLDLWSSKYDTNKEAILLRGMMSSNREVLINVLVDYPSILKEILFSRDNCLINDGRLDIAIFNFKKAVALGSKIAIKFLDEYKILLGEKKFRMVYDRS